MPLFNLLKSAVGTCPFCNQKASILSREHPDCRRAHQAGWKEMVELAADAAKSHEFNPNSLRVSLAEIARRSYGDGSTFHQALEEGWRRAVRKSRAGREHHSRRGIQTPEVPGPAGTEPEQRPRLCNGTTEPDIQAEAHGADPSRHHHSRRRRPPSETTLKSSPESRVRLGSLIHTGVHTSVVKAAVLREIAECVVPKDRTSRGRSPSTGQTSRPVTSKPESAGPEQRYRPGRHSQYETAVEHSPAAGGNAGSWVLSPGNKCQRRRYPGATGGATPDPGHQ